MESAVPTPSALSAEARRVYLRQVGASLPQVSERVRAYLLQRNEEVVFGEESQRLRDVFLRFKTGAARWEAAVKRRLDDAGPAETSEMPARDAGELSLVGEETVENQILAARAALVMVDKSSEVFNEFRLRLQHLDLSEELDKKDPVQALQFAQWLVDAWLEAGLTRQDWQICQSALHASLSKLVLAGYEEANRFLRDGGVLPSIDLRRLMRRSGPATGGGLAATSAVQGVSPSSLSPASMGMGVGAATMAGGLAAMGSPAGYAPMGEPFEATGGRGVGHQEVARRLLQFISQQMPQTSWFNATTGAGPLAVAPHGVAPSGLNVSAIPVPGVDWSSLEAGMAGLRAQSRVLKKAAHSDHEKAVIELVALMFDSILSEDRIPSSIRLWFARLQMPVLRSALSDPVFLTSEEHPARRLLDRMGSCVMGFDPTVKLDALEAEIKRIVQVIEQYPETGRKVFELMLKEFENFLSRAVESEPELHKVADVASQLEQRETLTVQYTIEMRKLLTDAPVHDSLRDFLFHVWTEVMAQASVVYGEKDERATRCRRLAADLLWAASAKPTRQERAQVIAKVPGLMAQLREGLAMLGHDEERIDAAIRPVSDALAAAFLSKSAAIDPVWLAQLTHQLAALEDMLSQDAQVDWVLSRDNLEMLTGQQADHLEVLANPEAPTPKHLLAWAAALPVGSWYSLEHNGRLTVVKLAWQSPRKQLYLFVNGVRQSWLMQQGRVAMYLKAGLLKPGEVEALTTRATRQALGKLEANPERLLKTE